MRDEGEREDRPLSELIELGANCAVLTHTGGPRWHQIDFPPPTPNFS